MDFIGYPLAIGVGSVMYLNRYLYKRYFNPPKERKIEEMIRRKFNKSYKQSDFYSNIPYFKKTTQKNFLLEQSLVLKIKDRELFDAEFVDRVDETDDKFPLNFKKLSSKFRSSEMDVFKDGIEVNDFDVEEVSKFFMKDFFGGEKVLFSTLVSDGEVLLNYEGEFSTEKKILEKIKKGTVVKSDQLDECLIVMYCKDTKKVFYVEQKLDKKISAKIVIDILQNKILKTEGVKMAFDIHDLVDFDELENFQIFGLLRLESDFSITNVTDVEITEADGTKVSQKIF